MKKLIQLKLKVLSKFILAKYKPEVIGITGSVGKTSTKEAIYTVLKSKFKVRRNIKNYNNEIGLPLTIIGANSPGKNIFGWFCVFWQAVKLILFKDKDYPEILVLEMGIDRPGDMDYLLNIVQCQIGVLTLIGTVHAEFFKSKGGIRREKSKLIESIPKSGWSIINYDNHGSRKVTRVGNSKLLTFGLEEKANVRAQEIKFSFNDNKIASDIQGISFKLSYQGSFAPVLLPQVLGIGAIYSSLAGAAVGVAKGMKLDEISKALEDYKSPRGRMRVIKGIKNTTIIDDTYNSEPESGRVAIGTLKMIPIVQSARRFAVLGDMLELGNYSEAGHQELGKYVARCRIDKLIVVGERARDIARGAKDAGMKQDNIFNFPESEEAGRFLQDRIKQGDLILVKGSQGIRMEKIVLEIMADPRKAKELLVRQDKSWENK